MKSFAFSLFFIISYFSLEAQNKLIAVGSGSDTYLALSFAEAVTNANAGDTIYMTGGTWAATVIDKELHIIGTGHHPDSTDVTRVSRLTGSLTFAAGSDGSSVEGVYFIGGNSYDTGGAIVIGQTANSNITNISIERCNLAKLYLGPGPTAASNASNIRIRENIIRYYIDGGAAQNVLVENNIISVNGSISGNRIRYFQAALFKNNIISMYMSTTSENNNVFTNNILVGSQFGVNSTFNNNVFTSSESNFQNTSSIDDGGNLFSQTIANTLVNSPNDLSFEYTNDYNIQGSSPANDVGSDGTDIGIYGGSKPWKPFSVPHNPHFVSKEVAEDTAIDGTLNIQINVTAQDN